MKRFWTQATVEQQGQTYAIRLDNRPMRLPNGPLLALQSEPLAQAIAEEWQNAPPTFTPDHLPLTQLAGTAQERIAPNPAPTIDALLKYAEADLLCYSAENPAELVACEEAAWRPWLDWAAERHTAPLRRARGITPIPQPEESLASLRQALAQHPPTALAGLGILVPATGSLILGLAVAEAALTPAEAHALSTLDELHQAEKWGDDPQAAARRAQIAADMEIAWRFIELSKQAVLF